MIGLGLGLTLAMPYAVGGVEIVGFVDAVTAVPTLPAGIQAGDLMVGVVQRPANAYAVAPSGWHQWEVVPFFLGDNAFKPGETLVQGDVSAEIFRVHLTSGSWDDGGATGFLTIINRTGGDFSTGAATSESGGAFINAQYGGVGGNSVSSGLAWRIAESSEESFGTWSLAGRRYAWVFRNAEIDVWAGNYSSSSGSVNWPSLAITPGATVCGCLYTPTNQDALSAAAQGPDGLNQRSARPTTASGGMLAVDGGPLSAFNPGSAKALANASNYSSLVFSVRPVA